jgi:tetratricopeptide (TPR) repeat protein/TolB-like protein
MPDERPGTPGGGDGVTVRAVAAARVFVGICLALLGSPPSGAAQVSAVDRSLHLVVPFENTTGEPRGYWLSEASAVLLTNNLVALGASSIAREDRLRAFERLRVPVLSTLSHATVIRLGHVVGAAYVVVGHFEVKGGDLTVRARILRLDTGQISAELLETGPLSDMLHIYGRLAGRIVPQSSLPVGQLAERSPPLSAMEPYVKGLVAEAPEAKIAFLTQALRFAPTFHRAHIALWEAHTDQGNHQEALAAVRQIPADNPFARQGRFMGGISLLHLGQLQAAFAEFSALNGAQRDAALLNNIGVVQLRRPPGAPGGKAVSFFGDAVAADGSDADLFFNAGYAAWLDRDTQGAIYWLREAVRRNPADDAAHFVLGVALQASGNIVEATREKELARRLSSTYAEWEARPGGADAVPRGLERLKLDIDMPASLRVEAVLGAAGQRDQKAIAAFHLDNGRRLFREGRDDEAIAELRRTIFLAPYESEAHLLLGRIYIRTGRSQDAIDALTIAAWSDPGNSEAKQLLDSLR